MFGEPRAGRPARRAPRWAPWLGGAMLPAVALTVIALLAVPSAAAGGGTALQAGPLLPVQGASFSGPTVSLQNPTVVGTEAPGFLGANVRPYYSLGVEESAEYAASGLQYVRWPGGAVVDEYNVTSNLIYNNDGSAYSPPTDVAAFAHWCVSVGCHAIVGLPAEIDSPSTAAYYVNYIERTVGFTPAYWEIGNEPAVWTHFGTPWSHWTTAQAVNATPMSYANLLHAYIAAIRGVDPTARFVGLGGVGTGAYGETTWITAAVRENGPNLSAISIHVYPAGGSVAGTVTAQSFYATLTGNSAISVRVPADRAAISSACPGCPIQLLASELGSGTSGGPFATYMSGFAVVPYLAAEVVQALQQNLSQVDLFAFESTYAGSILNGTGQPTEVATLYAAFLAPLHSQLLASNLTNPTRGLYVLPTRSPLGGAASILVADTNLTTGFSFEVRTAGDLPAPATFTVWNAGRTVPLVSMVSSAQGVLYRIGPGGVGLLQVGGGIVAQHPVPTPPARTLGLSFALPAPTVQNVLNLAAPTSMTFPCWAVATARRRPEI
jgi:Glycoside hydrolase family 44